MNQKDVWKKYITAQSKILEHKSRPIGIDTTKSVQLNGLKLHLSIDQEIYKQLFKNEVEQIFNIQNFNFESGYIQTSVSNTTSITPEQLSKLKELAEICYIDFNENPVIEGIITGKINKSQDELNDIIGEVLTNDRFKNFGEIYLTFDQFRNISKIDDIKFANKGTARFNIKPSAKFVTELTYGKSFFSEKLESLKELPDDVFKFLNENLNFKLKSVKLLISIPPNNDVESLSIIRSVLNTHTKLYPYQHDDGVLIILDKAKIRKADFNSLESVIDAVNELLSFYCNDFEYELSKSFKYSYDEAKNSSFFSSFLDVYRNEYESSFSFLLENNEIRVNKLFDAIYFDFETAEELNQKLDYVKSFTFFDIYNRGKEQKFKFNIKFETRLHELQSNLKKEFPNLNTKLIANGEKLIFRQFYQTGNKTEILARLNNQLNDFIDSESFNYTINDTFQEKYLCDENIELKVEQEAEKLSKLIRTEFFVCDEEEIKLFDIGTLTRVEYPNLTFTIETENAQIVENRKNEIIAIKPDLKGERDKIERL